MEPLKAIWTALKGQKRKIGLTATLLLGWANSQGWIPDHVNQLALGLLTVWGVVAIADAKKETK